MLQALGCDDIQGPYLGKAMKTRTSSNGSRTADRRCWLRKYQNAVNGEAALSGLGDTAILKWGNR
jgi:hypothetical protein